MADPSIYRPARGEIPTDPGVYRFRDAAGRVIYVGKAKNLRNRVSSYFAPLHTLAPKTRTMVTTAAGVEWVVVGSELESLQLEYTWIKQFQPRFNIDYRDDKSYPYLAVTMGEDVPRALVTRGTKKKGTRYFGPYSQAWAIRETLDAVLRVFPVRSCAPGVYRRAERSGRPCLLGYIGKCSAPCVGEISVEDHRALADDLCRFMSGHPEPFIKELEDRMRAAAAVQDFETAAARRDDVEALRKAFERNAVVLSDAVDADFFALADDELEAAVQVFHVRGGRIRGQRGWVTEKVEETDGAHLLEALLQQVYGERTADGASGDELRAHARREERGSHHRPWSEELTYRENQVPRSVLVSEPVENADQLEDWLSGLRGSRVSIGLPQRGEKAQLMETVRENARQALALHKSRRAGDITTRSASLQQLQEALDLPEALMRIECYDISHVQGTDVVASMVVFEDGLARKSEYRKFSITGDAARDDTASMYDVIHRRFSRHLAQQAETAEAGTRTGALSPEDLDADPAARKRFAYPPNLVVVDGGPPQVAAAARALEDLGVVDVAVVGLAKRLEEVWLPDDEFPVILPRASEALYLMQRIRDEAHRFAITFHRAKRGRSMISSVLDDLPGVGPAKQKALLKHFGSAKKLRAARVEEIQEVPGFGAALAAKVAAALQEPAATTGQDDPTGGLTVNTATGEILD
ncbi:excinuclease ABC subunit UvrC [Kocuria sp. JC486]|uniref:UvrABC system protein C n=1 Tax=Kocuria soli TaxID=2485125 RepID=A0A3N3ZRD0_9MICC|nr:excinuclease ABC subunit UvrC [Kocuria soli]NHU84043.1 excinuclease ABC subunit UvrC [Kocuria sp. JC486]ROZ63815.1 excinuclease ABC subunit UvrC [Kocuria soli]